jgi:tetratricopeptide (TPR) repeat protein
MLASQTRGILDIARGQYDDALEALMESLRLSRDLNDRQAGAIAEGYIGSARHLQGRYESAAASFASALQTLEALGDVRGLAEFTLRDAQLSLDTGMWNAAADNIERAKDLLKDDDNSARLALQLRVEGRYFDATGNARQAESLFVAALSAAESSGELLAILHARLALASQENIAVGSTRRIDELQAIHEQGSRLGHGELRYESGIVLGRAYLAAERFGEAEEVLRNALQPFRAATEVHGNYRLHALLADTLLAQGRGEEAETEWQQAGASVERALSNQSEDQRSAFRELPLVRRVLDRQGAGYES